ncbi:prepilin-type N-terminal cleavage/methylation domain-containing protein [Cupriavidus necator]|uniref:Type II secretion system protein H n=1 Tax=Cupriavidus necator TaxID=106590 RepID=A0A1U9UNU8_CUPNE|nr:MULTISPECIES: GspH/FimT family pseudopilin [Cupriavidus]AQV94107.1 prepilin-type N-terminal cleavage/methylation domain-containing protein [Cupriavidus necator]
MGFTLIELMAAVAIAGILAALAAPSFSSLIASQRAKAVASELFGSLSRTRSEAIMRNTAVTLSPKAGSWQSGWQILDPSNAANVLDDHGSAGGMTINGPASVTYRASGRLGAGAAPSFLITATAGSATAYQCVSVDLSGRPYMVAAPSC